MDKMKQWVALTALGALAIMAAGWFLLVSPKKAEATALQEQTASQLSANSELETQLTVLRAQAKELPKKQAALAKVAAKIPSNPSLPSLVRSLTAASTSAGVDFVSVTPGAPAAAVAPAAAAPAAPAAGTAAPAAASTSSAGQLLSIPVAINVVGDYFEVEQFIANLENLPRALRVTNLTLAPGAGPTAGDTTPSTDDGRSLTSTITGTVFMAAGAAPATAVVAPAAASAAAPAN
ncbi:MAG: hypothetical protein JWP11_1124 [Frankiales bacterium]|nr:hypothetical protein [Frankiales bacterium]